MFNTHCFYCPRFLGLGCFAVCALMNSTKMKFAVSVYYSSVSLPTGQDRCSFADADNSIAKFGCTLNPQAGEETVYFYTELPKSTYLCMFSMR